MVLLRAPAPGRAESTSPSSHPREDLASPSYIGSGVPEAWKVCVGASHLFKEAGISLSALAYSGQREERRTEVAQGRVWRVFSLRGKKKNQLMNWHPGHSPAWKWSPPCRHTKGHQPPKQTLGELVYPAYMSSQESSHASPSLLWRMDQCQEKQRESKKDALPKNGM